MTLVHIPCAPNNNRGEQLARIFLERELADTEGVLLTNYHIRDGNGTLENDLVLINRRGVWILEVKDWHGCINIDQFNWQQGNLIQHSPLISVETKAKALASILRNAKLANISVMGLVVLSQPDSYLNNTDDIFTKEPRTDKIFHLRSRLIRALTGEHYLYKPTNRELDMKLIERIRAILAPRSIDPGRQIIGNSYRIQHDLGMSTDKVFHAYKAEHVTIPERYARAKKYYTPAVSSTQELKEAIARFQRDMRALVKLERHPNIVQVYDYQRDRDSSDTYWLFLEWIKGITLRARLDYGHPIIPYQEQLRVLHAIIDALDCCHALGILHRNLNPACIYLADDGPIKLGDFDFARVPDLSITLTATGQPLPLQANRYMAPELRTNARDADARSDLYALGMIWYDMVVRPETINEPIDLALLETSLLPTSARVLLVNLLATNPLDRPESAKAVKTRLAHSV